MKQVLKVSSYDVWMSLGVTKEEQAQLQLVKFDVTLNFNQPLKGSATDQLDDAINYVALVSHIKQVATARSYNLIENVCFLTHQHITEWVKKHGFSGELITEALKVNPPVPMLQGGVKFICHSNV